MNGFKPRNAEEARVFAVERLIVDVQCELQELMNTRGITRGSLAKRLGVSEARVSQMFGDKCNLTLRVLARAFHALDAECVITSRLRDSRRGHWVSAHPSALNATSAQLQAVTHIRAPTGASAAPYPMRHDLPSEYHSTIQPASVEAA